MPSRKRLLDSDDWIDLKTSQVLATWSGRPGGAKWGLMKADFRLLRSEGGALVIVCPGNVLRIPYYISWTLSYDYLPVNPQRAVDVMAWSGGMKSAKRLFPDIAPQPIAPQGGLSGRQV